MLSSHSIPASMRICARCSPPSARISIAAALRRTRMLNEFELIRRYFMRPAHGAVLGVGDDAALVRVRRGMELVVSADMLVAGRHFFADADPEQLGHKALAVNLSDMAAMGATP